jgi:hypothetical protein
MTQAAVDSLRTARASSKQTRAAVSYRMTFQGFDRTTAQPDILGGKPCIRGMRLSGAIVLVNERGARARRLPIS